MMEFFAYTRFDLTIPSRLLCFLFVHYWQILFASLFVWGYCLTEELCHWHVLYFLWLIKNRNYIWSILRGSNLGQYLECQVGTKPLCKGLMPRGQSYKNNDYSFMPAWGVFTTTINIEMWKIPCGVKIYFKSYDQNSKIVS